MIHHPESNGDEFQIAIGESTSFEDVLIINQATGSIDSATMIEQPLSRTGPFIRQDSSSGRLNSDPSLLPILDDNSCVVPDHSVYSGNMINTKSTLHNNNSGTLLTPSIGHRWEFTPAIPALTESDADCAAIEEVLDGLASTQYTAAAMNDHPCFSGPQNVTATNPLTEIVPAVAVSNNNEPNYDPYNVDSSHDGNARSPRGERKPKQSWTVLRPAASRDHSADVAVGESASSPGPSESSPSTSSFASYSYEYHPGPSPSVTSAPNYSAGPLQNTVGNSVKMPVGNASGQTNLPRGQLVMRVPKGRYSNRSTLTITAGANENYYEYNDMKPAHNRGNKASAANYQQLPGGIKSENGEASMETMGLPPRRSYKRQPSDVVASPAYKNRRIRNNVAVRKSRQLAKARQQDTNAKMEALENENEDLRQRLHESEEKAKLFKRLLKDLLAKTKNNENNM